MPNMVVNVKLDPGAFMPERAHRTDAGADIRTPIDFIIMPGEGFIVGTGVHVETPPGCVSMLKSKSGLNVNHGIVSEGVIDEGYDGEIIVKLYNHGNRAKSFKRGDKITQLVIMPVHYPTFEEADSIGSGDRGSSGFGSTGK